MTIVLKKDNTSAEIDSLGAEMVSYQRDGVPCMWGGKPESWNGRAPILFPNVCALKDNTARFGGEPHTLVKHGFARRREFSLLRQDGGEVEFLLEASDETLAQYPYRFRLTVIHTLEKDGFSTTYTVSNADEKPMPFCIGGHPGFLCPIGDEGTFDDYDLVFPLVEDNEPLLPNSSGLLDGQRYAGILKNTDTIPLSHALFAKDALMFDKLQSRSVVLKSRNTGRALRFDFADFPYLGVWTTAAKNEPYICLEPWVGLPDFADCSGDFEDKPHCVTLRPGECRSFRYTAVFL